MKDEKDEPGLLDSSFILHPSSFPRVVGLVGGIGSGKSRVAEVFAEAGAVVISGDALGHQVLREPDVRAGIVERWGTEVLNEQGEVDRKKLGRIVFADLEERKALEALVHPRIKCLLQEALDRQRTNPAVPLVVLDAAIMLEAGWSDVCDRLVFVDVPREIRLERLWQQRGWTEKEVEARENAQWPLTEKKKHAQHVLDNSTSLENLRQQIHALFRHWGIAHSSAGA